jgi:TolB-like protein/AraC-like DNA-binding protein
MKSPVQLQIDRLTPFEPTPNDVKTAIEFMRQAICRHLSMADLAQHCGVAERTLNKHFSTFLGISPMRYFRRLRLAAARETLLSGDPGVTVTDVASRFKFNHFGRFAEQYRRQFGESPSETIRRGRAAASVAPGTERACETAANDSGPGPIRFPLASRERPSIAILPCRTTNSEPGLHEFAEGLADGIAAALSPARSLAVVVHATFRAPRRDPQGLARERSARYFLTGSIMRAGTKLRITLGVSETASGHHVWGDIFDGEFDEPLALQDRVVAGVVRAILPSIRGAEIERARRTPPQSLDAHGLAMRALPFVFASRPQATWRALELLHRAIEIDPDYGLATALAAWGHGQLVMYNGTPNPSAEKRRALELVHRAAILDDDDPLVLTARCAVHTMAREFNVAEALVTRALAIDPSSGWAWGRSGWLHSYRGKSDAAIEHFGRALALDPNVASRSSNFIGIGTAYFNAKRYDAVVQWVRKAMLEQPGMYWANRSLAVSYARLGDRLKALESIETLRRFSPDLTVGQVVAAVPYGPDFLERLGDGLSDLGLPP